MSTSGALSGQAGNAPVTKMIRGVEHVKMHPRCRGCANVDRKCWRAHNGVSCMRCIDADIECVRSNKRSRKKAGTVVDDDKDVLMEHGEASLAVHAVDSALASSGHEVSEHNTEPAGSEQSHRINGGPHVPESHTLMTNVEPAFTPSPPEAYAPRAWDHIPSATVRLRRLNEKMEKSHADHLRLKAMYERIEESAARSMEPDPMAEKRKAMCEYLGVPPPSRAPFDWNTEEVANATEDVSDMDRIE